MDIKFFKWGRNIVENLLLILAKSKIGQSFFSVFSSAMLSLMVIFKFDPFSALNINN